jgi:hypothetical protein
MSVQFICQYHAKVDKIIQYKEGQPKDRTIRDKFNTCRFLDYNGCTKM